MDDKMSRYRLATIEPWHVSEDQFRPEMNENAESIFSLSNEYMGTRGGLEEGFSGKSTLPGCYIGGIYVKEQVRYPWKRPGFPTFGNSMVNTANWLEIRVEVDSESFDLCTSRVSDYRRSLDMRQGLLSRRLLFTTRSGCQTQLSWERFVSHDDPHLGAIRFSLKAINHARPVKLTFAIDGRKENRDFATERIHSRMLGQQADAEGALLLTHFMTTGQYTIHRMSVETSSIPGLQRAFHHAEKRVELALTFQPEQGRELCFDKMVSVWTSRDAGYPHGLIPKNEDRTDVDPQQEGAVTAFLMQKSRENLALYINGGYERARARHAQKMSHLWDRCDVEIEGDPAAQQGIRYSIFQLLGTYTGRDSYLNIGPKGYSGECYNGRTFWDTESYCLPFYLFNNPESARKLLEYRYLALPAARDRAREFRYQGAMYPMTTLDGTEDTAVWEYAIGEIHINAAIAYAIFAYTHVTGDKSYQDDHGMEVLIEISRFFVSRSAFIPYRNGYALNRVMGPNEYGQCVNNNWYTNYMAKWVLQYTLQALEEMRRRCPDALRAVAGRTAFDFAETDRWRDVADKIILNYEPQMKVFIENDLFLSLDPLSREELDRDLDIPIERKWSIEKYQKYQISKQPDVLLAMFLLRDRFTIDEKRNNYRFYEQRCVHGSSLSPAVHSILACEVGRYAQAYEYYLWSSRLDLDDFNNNTHEGLHISSMSGSWLNIVCGFGGMVYTGPALEFAPILPPAWTKYRFKFFHRGRIIQVSVDAQQVAMELLAGDNLFVRLYGKDVELTRHVYVAPLSAAYRRRPAPKAVILDLDCVVTKCADGQATQAPVQPGIPAFLDEARHAGLKTALLAADQGAGEAFCKADLAASFDLMIEGDQGSSKANESRLLQASQRLGVPAESCVVIGKSFAGLNAALAAGMRCIGIGDKTLLHQADYTLPSTKYLNMDKVRSLY